MALAAWQATIVDEAGNVQDEASVEVLLESSGALAALFSDRDGANPIDNPVIAGEDGFVRFYAAGGAYRINASLGAFSRTWRHVAIGIIGERDVVTESLIRYERTAAESAASVTPTNYYYPPGNVLRYGTNSTPGTTNMTAAFTAARAVTSGRYHIPVGTYLVDASPDVWADAFTADGDTELVISATTYDISNAFAGRLRYRAASSTKLDIVDAVTENIVVYLQNSEPGTATGFYRGLAFTTDSHWCQVQPATDGGSVDLLWQRSTLNADPGGNRFSETFDETNDRFQISYATTASGSPSFDSAIIVGAGTSAYLHFPALQPQFNQGWSVKQRSAGGFELEAVATATTTVIRNKGTPANVNLILGDGTVGFFGGAGTAKPEITGSAGGNAALQSLLTALEAMGLITDSST